MPLPDFWEFWSGKDNNAPSSYGDEEMGEEPHRQDPEDREDCEAGDCTGDLEPMEYYENPDYTEVAEELHNDAYWYGVEEDFGYEDDDGGDDDGE